MSAAPGQTDRPKGRNKGLLKEKLELEKVKTKDGRTRVTLKPIDDELTFDKGFYVFIRALQLLRAHNDGVVLVGLGGASGSGKTAFSHKVKDFMPGIAIVSMDMYNDASKLVDENFDDPRLTDYDLLMQNLADLKAGKPADVPIYDFKQSKRVGYNTVPVPESRVVIIEGIYALSERLKPLLDLRVSITGGVHFDLVKRVLRDINRSGQGPEEIIQQITDTVFPMYKAFIEPDLNAAQLKIHNSFNPFTGFMNATYILKSARQEDLTQQAVVAVLGDSAVVKTEAEMYDIHLLPPNEDPETCASWLRMRNRDGRYTLMFEEWVTEGDFIISPRIQFEVSVRVLGGLMSLGYQIGTIMRRTSTLIKSSTGDITVKFDDVENLGKFVQVQGKDREKVASVAEALHLQEFIPRSYIEQVQLSKLTQDFQNFTDAVRKRFSMSGNNALEALHDVYGSSPPPFGGLLTGRGGGGFVRGGGSRVGNGRGGIFSPGPNFIDEGLLSTSAPVQYTRPIPIQASCRKPLTSGGGSLKGVEDNQQLVSPSSSAVAVAGSTAGPSSLHSPASSIPEGNGSFADSLDNVSEGSAAITAAAMVAGDGTVGVSAGQAANGRATGRPPSAGVTPTPSPPAAATAAKNSRSLLGQQLRRSSHQGSSGSLAEADNANDSAAVGGVPGESASQHQQQQGLQTERSHRISSVGGVGAQDHLSNTGGLAGEAGIQLIKRFQEQIEIIGEGFKRHSGMQLHLDALTHQYKHLNESMASLTAATQALQECVRHLQQQQLQVDGAADKNRSANKQLHGATYELPALLSSSSSALFALSTAAAIGMAIGALISRGTVR